MFDDQAHKHGDAGIQGHEVAAAGARRQPHRGIGDGQRDQQKLHLRPVGPDRLPHAAFAKRQQQRRPGQPAGGCLQRIHGQVREHAVGREAIAGQSGPDVVDCVRPVLGERHEPQTDDDRECRQPRQVAQRNEPAPVSPQEQEHQAGAGKIERRLRTLRERAQCGQRIAGAPGERGRPIAQVAGVPNEQRRCGPQREQRFGLAEAAQDQHLPERRVDGRGRQSGQARSPRPRVAVDQPHRGQRRHAHWASEWRPDRRGRARCPPAPWPRCPAAAVRRTSRLAAAARRDRRWQSSRAPRSPSATPRHTPAPPPDA